MSARILIDLEAVHPVAGGHWHRVARLQRLPNPGEEITMMCGRTEPAEFVATSLTSEPAPTTCWGCDLVYRQAMGIPVQPGHPALQQGSFPSR